MLPGECCDLSHAEYLVARSTYGCNIERGNYRIINLGSGARLRGFVRERPKQWRWRLERSLRRSNRTGIMAWQWSVLSEPTAPCIEFTQAYELLLLHRPTHHRPAPQSPFRQPSRCLSPRPIARRSTSQSSSAPHTGAIEFGISREIVHLEHEPSITPHIVLAIEFMLTFLPTGTSSAVSIFPARAMAMAKYTFSGGIWLHIRIG